MKSADRRLDNFDRHVWAMFGASIGIVCTAWLGWAAAIGWFIGWGFGLLLVFALASGRLTFRRKRVEG